MESPACESCSNAVSNIEGGVHLGSIEDGYRFLCMPCYNAAMVEYTGVDFEHPHLQPVVLKDVDGLDHEFHFTTRLLGDRIAIDAHEVQGGEKSGYKFQQIDFDPEREPLEIVALLLQKMRRALAQKHLEQAEHGIHITKPNIVRGHIDWDDETDGQQPRVVIDGKEFSWTQLGRMVMSYEGWQFKLEIKDPSEEV